MITTSALANTSITSHNYFLFVVGTQNLFLNDRSQKTGYLVEIGNRVIQGRSLKELSGAGNILFLDLGGGHMHVYMCKNSLCKIPS